MNEQKRKEERTHPINYILLAASLIVFGSLGLAFVTQMELQPGWVWEEVSGKNSMEMNVFEADDLNNDGFLDAIAYSDVIRQNSDNQGDLNDIPNYGNIYALDGLSGSKIWEKICNNPVKKVFEVMDVNGDGYKDYFANIASVESDWKTISPGDNPTTEIILNDYSNILIYGNNGTDIPIATGDHRSFTNFFVQDLVHLDGLDDNRPDLIFLECESKTNATYEYFYNISSYFVNGTKFDSIYIDFSWISEQDVIPAMDLFPYGSEEHVLFINSNKIMLLNTSVSNFLDPIFNKTLMGNIRDYTFTEDLNGDSIPEIFLTTETGNVSIISGIDGSTIRTFNVPREIEYHIYGIETLGSNTTDQEVFLIIKGDFYDDIDHTKENQILIYVVTETSENIFRPYHDQCDENDELQNIFVLGEDLNGDSIDEIVLWERFAPWYSPTSEVSRFSIVSIPENEVLSVINTNQGTDRIIPFQDLNGDGKGDFILASNDRIAALASSKPIALWLSPLFPLGFPLFIILVALLCIGIFLVLLKSKKVSYSRKKIKEHKLTVAVNIAAIALISVTFLLFLIQLNIFNNTLIPNENMTSIVISFLVVIITWYGTLPLTAALYNRFASRFAYTFVKLRSLFFKISKSYNTDILVLDMKDRKEIGTIIQLKRTVLPLMLSIAIGFYTYGVLTPILGYPQNFEVFGSTEFFQFMNGYLLMAVFPMILTFLVFSFFISGNFLLDDAGIVYFRQSKKYRQPGDIEPISIWAQSMVKGMAGISAIITLIGFLTTVDFSGFFQEDNPTSIIFGVLIITVFFAGIPFLTAFSYVLLAGEVMEFSIDFNTQKLYSLMEEKGYDTTPKDITNIYPEGFSEPKKPISDDLE